MVGPKQLFGSTRRAALAVAVLLLVGPPARSAPQGEAYGGFPSWGERVLQQWTNRARCDPAVEMAACGSNCLDGACYAPRPPLVWSLALNRSARFHCDEMSRQNYVGVNSLCSVPANIDALYPAACDGSAACACAAPSPATSWHTRIGYFGPDASGEVVTADVFGDPVTAFYLMLFEPTASAACGFHGDNGRRHQILTSTGSMGAGVSTPGAGVPRMTIDFAAFGTPARIVSGSHYPRQAESVEAWASWYDASAPLGAWVVVDGLWIPLALGRGSATNGAWTATIPGVGTGCHRYFFAFRDAAGALLRYPGVGTLGIGPQGSCADWDPAPPLVARPFCAGDGSLPTPCPCANPGASGRGCANSQVASGGHLAALGATTPDTLVLHASGLPALASPAVTFFQGNAADPSGVVFGDGVRCVTGSLVRLGTRSAPSGFTQVPGAGGPPISVSGGVTPGSAVLRWYQAAYRNAAPSFCPPATFNITSGLEIVW